ncbi:GFA family protein [Phenylobacterium sp.]|uniref:GFA family protein n=1 Tax=Phenylobacterium sp. TaxID=1871053 RepID=UPI00374DBA3F
MTKATHLCCTCGKVEIETVGTPIISAACCCNSCRTAAARLHAESQILGPFGETRFELYRKDRVRFLRGVDQLQDFHLQAGAKTRRVIATCCNTPIFLEFGGAHWLNVYGGLWPAGSLPPPALRTMTSDLAYASLLPTDVPNHKRQSASFFAKLFAAWIAMGFRTPEVPVNGEFHAKVGG